MNGRAIAVTVMSIALVVSTFAGGVALLASVTDAAGSDVGAVDGGHDHRSHDHGESDPGDRSDRIGADDTSAREGPSDGAASDDGAETPPSKHLGYGGPADGAAESDGGEFSFGAPPVPPSGPSAAARDGHDRGGHDRSESDRHGRDGRKGHGSSEYVMSPADENATVEGLEVAVAGTESRSASLAAETQSGDASNVCPSGSADREFKVHAIQVPIVYNAYGQYDPDGRMYVLDENLGDVREATRKGGPAIGTDGTPKASIADPDPNVTSSLVEPLTLRAHVGDCVKIEFVNHLDRPASIHPTGTAYNPRSSDGMEFGRNGGSVAAPDGENGDEVTYYWYAQARGSFSFADGANPVLHDDDETLRQHGLFGALIVEERGTKWLDPETGERTRSGTRAIVQDPDGPDFREFAVYYHDSAGVVNADGSQPTFPNGEEQSLYTLNYRGDPTGARLAPKDGCADCTIEEHFYSSWVHGDPGGGDLVFPAYVGDPIKYHVIGSQAEEKHVHHHHGHRWKSEPGDADSRTQDAQTVSTDATYAQEFVAGFGQFSSRPGLNYEGAFGAGGAGYVQGSPGDYIFHCHLFPHYASGMWAILRVHDKAQGDLTPLPDRSASGPEAPSDEDPGFPYFVKEGYNATRPSLDDLNELNGGEAAPLPPLSSDRGPTAVEESALNGTGTPGVFDAEGVTDPIKPGAPYADPCPEGAEVREYEVVLLETEITYNNDGDHDPKALVYALAENEEAIRSGEMRPRPLTIRANVGECVEITLTNRMPEDREPNAMSMHVHFVGYDVLGSDGVNVGYNYQQGVEPGEEITYRWYADEEGTIFWHDHLSGFAQGMHGTFGTLVVEPEGSKWLDPETGDPIRSGTEAMIVDPNGENYREFVLAYQDFVRLFDRNGDPINPPHLEAADGHSLNCEDPTWCESLEDHGVMGINYANAPLFHRDDADPAYAFSSWVHGDPQTPVLETYPNDKVKIRVLQGTFEEAHTFTMHGVRWHQEEHDGQSPLVASQTFGTSEQYEAHFEAPEQNPGGVPMADYWYGSTPIDDTWTGMWGLMRVWGVKVPHLEPLPGSDAPGRSADRGELRQLSNEGLRAGADRDSRGGGPPSGGPGTQERGDSTPPKAPTPGEPCPSGADVREYDVVAFTTDIPYNDFGDHDPHGVVFATREDYEAIRAGEKDPEPLVLRASAGECIEVTLENKLPEEMDQHTDHASVPVTQRWTNSNRISLHPQLVEYDVQRSDGTTAGFNWDQTIPPGEEITYRWHADEELGTSVLWDMADVRSHRHHGAYGLLIVEPEGSTWYDPYTGEPAPTGAQAVVHDPDGQNFREYALAVSDGAYVVNADGTCPVRPGHEDDRSAPCNRAIGDPENQGFKGVNYRSEPLGPTRRMGEDGREHKVFDSGVHGDPATPLLEAYAGDPVRFRVAQTADKPPGTSFRLAGHQWPHHWTEPGVQYEGAYGLMPAGSTDVVPVGGAGGPRAQPGDYYYGASKLRGYVEGGLWGIFRVHPDGAATETGLLEISEVDTVNRNSADATANETGVTANETESATGDPNAGRNGTADGADGRAATTGGATTANGTTNDSETVNDTETSNGTGATADDADTSTNGSGPTSTETETAGAANGSRAADSEANPGADGTATSANDTGATNDSGPPGSAGNGADTAATGGRSDAGIGPASRSNPSSESNPTAGDEPSSDAAAANGGESTNGPASERSTDGAGAENPGNATGAGPNETGGGAGADAGSAPGGANPASSPAEDGDGPPASGTGPSNGGTGDGDAIPGEASVVTDSPAVDPKSVSVG